MKSTVLMFPGQGSQYVGMLKDFYDFSEQAPKLFQQAEAITGLQLKSVMFEGPQEKLNRTEYAQLSLFLSSYLIFLQFKSMDIPFDMLIGHSLGEFSAHLAAGTFDFETGLKIVSKRASLMSEASDSHPGRMSAILGLEDNTVESICSEVASNLESFVSIANRNCPGQVVISGTITGVARASYLATQRGAKRIIPLPVQGAFHSKQMAKAQQQFDVFLKTVALNRPKYSVFSSICGNCIDDVENIRHILSEQMVCPVLWQQSVSGCIAMGANRFIELGPGRVLQGLLRRIAPELKLMGISTVDDLRYLNL